MLLDVSVAEVEAPELDEPDDEAPEDAPDDEALELDELELEASVSFEADDSLLGSLTDDELECVVESTPLVAGRLDEAESTPVPVCAVVCAVVEF